MMPLGTEGTGGGVGGALRLRMVNEALAMEMEDTEASESIVRA